MENIVNDNLLSKQVIPCVDVAKLFFCLCVIGIHTRAVWFLPEATVFMIEKCIFRLAVPYFFVASGFFIGEKIRKCDNNVDIKSLIKQYCIRLLKPYVVFETINVIQTTLLMLRSGERFSEIISTLFSHLVFDPYGALWYVWASMIAICLLYPFLKQKKINISLLAGLALYVWALFCNSYFFLVDGTLIGSAVSGYLDICMTARNGVFTGFLFIGLGIKCSEISRKITCSLKKLSTITVIWFAVYFAEIWLVYYMKNSADDTALFICHIILIPSLLLLTIRTRIQIKDTTAVYMRNLSTGMYFLHRPILWFADRILNLGFIGRVQLISALNETNLIYIMIFAAVAGCSCMICVIVYKIKKEPIYSLLR